MRPLLFLTLLLGLPLSSRAEVKIVGPVSVPEHRAVRLRAEGSDKDQILTWDVSDDVSVDIVEEGERLVFTAPPGDYAVKLRAINVATKKAETARVTVTIRARNPQPVPPGPLPPPIPPVPPVPPGPLPPTPITRAWLVAVEATAEAAAERGQWLSDPAVVAYVRSKAWKHRVVDKDVKDASGKVPADVKPYIDRAAGKKLPQLFVVDQDGGVRYEGAVPSTPAALLQLLQKIGG